MLPLGVIITRKVNSMHYQQTIPIYAPYPHMVARYPINYIGGYEPPEWEFLSLTILYMISPARI